MMGTIARRLTILIFAFLTTVLWGFDKKAVELNDLGYQAYEAKDYPKALEYFSFNTRGDVTMAVGIDVVPCTVVRQGRYAIMGSDLILYIKGYSQPVQCEYNTRTSGYAGERSDDFLWGKITTEGVDLSREGYGLIDSKNTTNYQCRTPVEPGPWQTAEVRSVTTGPGETGFSLRQIRFRARE